MVVSICRSSHRRCSVRKVVHKNFSKFTGKLLCQSLFFNKVAGLRFATLWKKRLWYRCFQVNVAKFLRAPSFTEHLWATAFVFGTTLTKHLAMSIVNKRRRSFICASSHACALCSGIMKYSGLSLMSHQFWCFENSYDGLVEGSKTF